MVNRQVLARWIALCAVWVTLSGVAGAATIVTVGDDEPGADFTRIQDAIDAVVATPGLREVRVAAGRYPERLRIDHPALGLLQITGGWDPLFRDRRFDPASTIVENRVARGGRVVSVICTAGQLRLEGLTLTGGSTEEDTPELDAGWGGGILVRASGTCDVDLGRLHVEANLAEKTRPGGAGHGRRRPVRPPA